MAVGDPRVERFIGALHRLEGGDGPDALVSQFAPEAVMTSPTLACGAGNGGAGRFWTAYRRGFREIRSEFGRVVQSDETAFLEWTSRGTTAAGRSVEYGGVSVLSFDGDRIARFRAYFDPGPMRRQRPR